MNAGRPDNGAVQFDALEDRLPQRLAALGLRQIERVVTHTNRTVMLSLNKNVLRVHRGYAFAPDRVLRAIVRFLNTVVMGLAAAPAGTCWALRAAGRASARIAARKIFMTASRKMAVDRLVILKPDEQLRNNP